MSRVEWMMLFIYCFRIKWQLTLSCRWGDILTRIPPPKDCLYLGYNPSVLDNSFFAESLGTSYNFLASLQIAKFLDKFLSVIYSRQERDKCEIASFHRWLWNRWIVSSSILHISIQRPLEDKAAGSAVYPCNPWPRDCLSILSLVTATVRTKISRAQASSDSLDMITRNIFHPLYGKCFIMPANS